MNQEEKERIREKYEYTCQHCGVVFSDDLDNYHDLHIHHRDGDQTNNDRDNLLLLCSSCHKQAHMAEDRVVCPMCFRTFEAEIGMQRHKGNAH